MEDGDANPMFSAVRCGSGGGGDGVLDVLLAHGARIDPRDSRWVGVRHVWYGHVPYAQHD